MLRYNNKMHATAALRYFDSLQQHNTNTRREDRFFKGANHSLVFANPRHSMVLGWSLSGLRIVLVGLVLFDLGVWGGWAVWEWLGSQGGQGGLAGLHGKAG